MTASDQHLIETWAGYLDDAAEPYDLTDESDRVLFRQEVRSLTAPTKVSFIIELARYYGPPLARNSSRDSATRVLADAWITNQLKGDRQ